MYENIYWIVTIGFIVVVIKSIYDLFRFICYSFEMHPVIAHKYIGFKPSVFLNGGMCTVLLKKFNVDDPKFCLFQRAARNSYIFTFLAFAIWVLFSILRPWPST
jgi:hypothetical protein